MASPSSVNGVQGLWCRLSANPIDRTDQQSEPRRKLGDARAHGLGKGGALTARSGRMRLGGGTARQHGSTGECSGRAVVQRGGAATAAAQRLRRRKQREGERGMAGCCSPKPGLPGPVLRVRDRWLGRGACRPRGPPRLRCPRLLAPADATHGHSLPYLSFVLSFFIRRSL